MSEEETIKQVENAIWFMKEDNYNVNTFVKAIQGLLDLYKENTLQIEKLKKEIKELKKDKLELINKNHVVHLKDVEKELGEMRKEIERLNVIHESFIVDKEKEITKLNNEIYELKKRIHAINLLSYEEE